MKKALVALLFAAPLTAWSQMITVNSFDNIGYWSGSGTNSAALVLEFGNSINPSSIAWGYRWNGTATAASMLFAIAGSITGSGVPSPQAGADARLTVDGTYFASFDDYLINTISYDQIGLPSPWGQSLRLMEDNYYVDGTYPSLYSLAGSGTWTNGGFAAASVGISMLSLTDGGWIGFAQTDGTDPYTFSQPVSAVPEPQTFSLIAMALVALVALGLRKKAS
ncbi:MAG: hypothetical protein JHC85_09895 [Chthoniobacterales bacterium]|nr:hypothetical protein [Chthoniobacterales bacterium]